MIWLALTATLTVGYILGRARLGHRASQWAAWRSIGQPPTGWRYAATWTVLSAENLGWLIAHPRQGWHAWKHRNDPPPPKSPPVQLHGPSADRPAVPPV